MVTDTTVKIGSRVSGSEVKSTLTFEPETLTYTRGHDYELGYAPSFRGLNPILSPPNPIEAPR